MAFSLRQFFSLRKSKPDTNVYGPRRGFSFLAGVAVTEDTAMKVAAFYRGVMYVSTQVAKLPWNVKDKDQNLIEDAVYHLLNLQPNPEMNALSFRLLAVQTAIIHGNHYSEIERDILGRPIAVWPIQHGDVDLVRTQDGELLYRVQGASAKGGTQYLQPRDVFHVKAPHTKDGLIGQGIVAYGSQVLGISIAADKMASGLFANGGMPSGYLKYKGVLSDEAYERLRDDFKEQYGGENAGGVAILEEDTEFHPIEVDYEGLQMLDTKKFGVLEIARFIGVHPTKLFDVTSATYSNVEQANLDMATDVLDFWARNLEIEADIKLLSRQHGGKFTEFDLYAVFRGDMTTRANYNSKMMQMGATSPNEVRAREGMAGYKGGDRFYIARNNFVPQDRQDEIIDAEIKGKNKPSSTAKPGEDAEDDDETLDRDLKKAAKAVLERK